MKRISPPLPAAIVLAGGQSRRMGQDKALLQLQGDALLTRSCRTAQAVGQQVLVVAACSAYRSLLPRGCGLMIETDPQGPLRAFACGLAQVQQVQQVRQDNDDWVLLLACDLPLLGAADLMGAIAHLAALPASIDAYLPPAAARPGRGTAAKPIKWEPLCGFYRQRCLTPMQAAIAQGTRSFQSWLTDMTVAPLEQWPSEHLLNCNRPQDWRRVLERLDEWGAG